MPPPPRRWERLVGAAIAVLVIVTGITASIIVGGNDRPGGEEAQASPPDAAGPTATPSPADPDTRDPVRTFDLVFTRLDRPDLPPHWYRMVADDGSFSLIGAAPGSLGGMDDSPGWEIDMATDPATCLAYIFDGPDLSSDRASAAARRGLRDWADAWGEVLSGPRSIRLGRTAAWTARVRLGAERGTILSVNHEGRQLYLYASPGPDPSRESRHLASVCLDSVHVPARAE